MDKPTAATWPESVEYVEDYSLAPTGRRWRRTEVVLFKKRKYERCLVPEDGVFYQRILSDDESLAGPWRDVETGLMP